MRFLTRRPPSGHSSPHDACRDMTPCWWLGPIMGDGPSGLGLLMYPFFPLYPVTLYSHGMAEGLGAMSGPCARTAPHHRYCPSAEGAPACRSLARKSAKALEHWNALRLCRNHADFGRSHANVARILGTIRNGPDRNGYDIGRVTEKRTACAVITRFWNV